MKHRLSLLLQIIILATALTWLISCGEDKVARDVFSRAEHLMDTDSAQQALTLLSDMQPKVATLPRAQRMRYYLLQAKAQNKAAVNFTTDSIMNKVVAYYDRYGSHNDRLLAHYLLGCVYRDLGEAPHAIGCYQDAVDCADTLSATCDFKTLSCVYSQMAWVYRKQLALSDAIESRNKSIQYSLQIGDTLNSLYDLTKAASEFMMLNLNDSAEAIFMKAKEMYMDHDCQREWAIASLPLAYIYLLPPQRLSEAKAILDLYKIALDEPTPQGKQPPSRRMYHYYQGLYYEALNNLDSAEWYFRRMSNATLRNTDLDAMYHGLLDVYKKKDNIDSIYKYTLLYCQANDSSVVAKDRDLIVQMKATYNYNRMQKEALRQAKRAARVRGWLMFFISVAIILLMLFVWLWTYFKRRRRQKQEELERTRQELAEAEAEYNKEKRQLELLEITHKESLRLIQEDLTSLRKETDGYRIKYNEAQHKIEEINALYEENIRQHNVEMERVQTKIETLRQKPGVIESLDVAHSLKETEIVKRVLYLASKSNYNLTTAEWETLTREFGKSYPTLLADLHQVPSISEKGIRVGILVVLKLRESDIAHFVGISDTAVSNYKTTINLALFQEKTSRTLFQNLERRYGLLS